MMSLPSSQRAAKGFSLAEVLISVGILAIGMTMAAALWPAAIRENQNSASSTLGSIICENGLAIIQAKYHNGCVGTGNASVLVDPTNASAGVTNDCTYSFVATQGNSTGSSVDPNMNAGFCAVARRLSVTENAYQVTVMAYAPHNGAVSTVRISPIYPAGITFSGNTVVSADVRNDFKVGAPIIMADGGYAIVKTVTSAGGMDTAILDRSFTGSPMALYTLQEDYVVALKTVVKSIPPLLYITSNRIYLKP